MDDRPGREEEHGRLPRAVHLVEGAHAVPFDIPLVVGVPRARLLAPDLVDRFHYGFASKTRLNGVSAARRKCVKPPLVTTSRIRASPACAPSASPTSWDSEAGVQSSVENP